MKLETPFPSLDQLLDPAVLPAVFNTYIQTVGQKEFQKTSENHSIMAGQPTSP